ncbi:MAG: phosphoserine phosphatase SerB [Alphaproteobacteria bacterium]|nr:phosphoserine phosphatase SerB [Alphaproteobacteria bacterium]
MPASLATQGLVVQKIDTLKEGVACDFFVEHPDAHAVDVFVQQVVADQPYDAIVQPVATRRKKLLISDMDSTMITVECIDELADFVGKKAEVSIITDRAMNGELDFAAALTERVALLRGLSEKMLQEAYDERVKMMGGAKALVAHMRGQGARCVLVSGGFTFFTSRVREELGFHADFSNQLEIQNGMLTGRVIPPILGKEAKLATMLDECKKLGITPEEVMAIGDGANDLPMLLNAGLGVAYHAKPIVRAQANARLNYCDLSALIWVMGRAI